MIPGWIGCDLQIDLQTRIPVSREPVIARFCISINLIQMRPGVQAVQRIRAEYPTSSTLRVAHTSLSNHNLPIRALALLHRSTRPGDATLPRCTVPAILVSPHFRLRPPVVPGRREPYPIDATFRCSTSLSHSHNPSRERRAPSNLQRTTSADGNRSQNPFMLPSEKSRAFVLGPGPPPHATIAPVC